MTTIRPRILRLLLAAAFLAASAPAVADIDSQVLSPREVREYHKGAHAYENRDYARALRWWRPLAEKGDPFSQVALGNMYEQGLGVQQDFVAAAAWYRRAADRDNAEGAHHLGLMHLFGRQVDGKGVVRNVAEAAFLFRKAADRNHAGAQSDLGYLYETGQGVPQDFVEAVKWYRRSAEQGHPLGQSNLANMYRHGRGVRQDHALAFSWYQRSARQGEWQGQLGLAAMHGAGLGVSRDQLAAHAWLIVAAGNGSEEASRRIEELGARVSSAEVNEAQRLARRCVNSGYVSCP